MARKSKVIWNPYSPGYFENPYEHLKLCRNSNPIHELSNGNWIMFAYEDINQALGSSNFMATSLSQYLEKKEEYIFKNSNQCPFLAKGTKKWPIYMNGEEHKVSRIMMGKSLNIENLEVQVLNSVDQINNKYNGAKSLDLVLYASEFIHIVLKNIFGFKSDAQFEEMRTYSNMLAKSQDINVPRQVYQEINKWFLWGRDIFSESAFQNSLSSLSLENELHYTEDEIYSFSSLALMAAFETSRDNLSILFYHLLQEPMLVDYILDCSKKELNILVEEIFRFTSPQQYTIRINKSPIQTAVGEIPQDSKIYLCLASANHDETVFEEPDRIIVDRKKNNHLAFGKGSHFCLGSTIARSELRSCLKPMVSFLKDFRPTNTSPVSWSKQIFMRTATSIPISKI